MELDVMFKAWSDHAEHMEKTADKMLGQHVEPLRKNLGVANVPSAATAQVLNLGGPAAGRMWFVHRVAILGADGHTAVSGAIADIYTGTSLLADASSEIYAGLPIPSIIIEGRHHNPVLFGEKLYVMLYTLPAQQIVQFSAGIEDYPAPDQLAMRVG
jgi:hypothetical protein